MTPEAATLTNLQAINPSLSPRYSPNLFKFMKRASRSFRRQLVYREGATGCLWIGEIEDGFLIGIRLMRVLCQGGKAYNEIGAMVNIAHDLTEIPDFWSEYQRIGRCAIDADHSMSFIGDEDRYSVSASGSVRVCNWCLRKQYLHRWTATVTKEAWSNAPVTEKARLIERA
jgi:hypothetical protein